MWKPDQIHMQTYASDDLKICRMAYSGIENQNSTLDFEYLVGEYGGIQKFTEKHELGLFDHDTVKTIFDQCGLVFTFHADGLTGRGLYHGTIKSP